MNTTNDEKILALRAVEGLDVDSGLKNVMNMSAVYVRVLGVFVKNTGKDRKRFDEYVNTGELVGFNVMVHGYKSALKSLGATELSAAAAQLEAAGLNTDTEFVKANLPSFIDGIEALAEALEKILD